MARFDVEVGQHAVEPIREGPVGGADEVHSGGQEEAADDESVNEDGEGEPEAELLEEAVAAEEEGPEDQDHDAGGGDDDAVALGLAERDSQVVELHLPPPGRDVAGAGTGK